MDQERRRYVALATLHSKVAVTATGAFWQQKVQPASACPAEGRLRRASPSGVTVGHHLLCLNRRRGGKSVLVRADYQGRHAISDDDRRCGGCKSIPLRGGSQTPRSALQVGHPRTSTTCGRHPPVRRLTSSLKSSTRKPLLTEHPRAGACPAPLTPPAAASARRNALATLCAVCAR